MLSLWEDTISLCLGAICVCAIYRRRFCWSVLIDREDPGEGGSGCSPGSEFLTPGMTEVCDGSMCESFNSI